MNNLFVIRKKRESEKELVGQQGINLRPEIAFPPSSSIGQQWLDGPVDHLALGGVVRRRLATHAPATPTTWHARFTGQRSPGAVCVDGRLQLHSHKYSSDSVALNFVFFIINSSPFSFLYFFS